ncbi:MBL fold metallo-hydrolase [Halalkalibacter krulwichiae]|uniref:Ribonuclease Z n=1 Tax=Halalkalibacter krulwichiae TaxID=199441 RepID=A0A1X9MDR7_9BACI|nr:MBL fold metallo-hydrolase [Halalkalibacter krulwichiae]ARK31578.1 ribonuclease Z [Halalkalibacter krulwichiae]
MRLTVVGYWHGYPEKGEATSGYLLEDGDVKLLLDFGSGVVSQLQNYCSVQDLDGIVLSHYHQDHQADIGVYQYARLINNGMNKRLKETTIYGHQDDEQAFSKLSYKNAVTSQSYQEGVPLSIGPFTFTFKKTMHPVPCYAMHIENKGKTIVYTADTSYFSGLADFTQGVDLLIAECSGYEGDQIAQYGHMTSEDVGKLAKQAKPGKIVLTHLPHAGEHEQLQQEVAKHFYGEIILARSGSQLTL